MPEIELRTLHMLGTGSPSCNPSFCHTKWQLLIHFWKTKLHCHTLWPNHLGYNLNWQFRDESSTTQPEAIIQGLARNPGNLAQYAYSGLNNDQSLPDSLHSEIWVNTHKQQVQETQHETEEKLLSNRKRSGKGSKSKRRSKISKAFHRNCPSSFRQTDEQAL